MQATSTSRLVIPESLRDQILAFRRRVWTIKLIEAVAGAVAGIFVGYLLTYALDRFVDTPQAVRMALFGAAIVTCGLIPWALDRWVWRQRRLDQLARLLSQKHPSVGDQLLGIIELADNPAEQARSPRLVEAAIEQVTALAAQRDFRDAVPAPKHRQRGLLAVMLMTTAVVLLGVTHAAATNAWARFATPWTETPRYTFAAIEQLPERVVVPHGEVAPVSIELNPQSEWKPETAAAQLGQQAPLTAKRNDKGYQFELPGQIQPTSMKVQVGDFYGTTLVEPMHRPDLTGLTARVQLPQYLERTEPLTKEIRGTAVSVVQGSTVQVTGVATRELASASQDGQTLATQGDQFTTKPIPVSETGAKVELQWTDPHGLTALEPLELQVQGAPDEAPSLVCENMPRMKVLLDSEVLTFQVRARDDFGVKRVGVQWKGLDPTLKAPAAGEKIIGAGNSLAELLDLAATFSAKQYEIEPQPIELRVFVEDYLPGRERVYSPACTFYILNAEEHAIWVTAQMSRWHRMALDVRDRELQLFETNKELRDMPGEMLDDPQVRERIETQAAAERANGRRLGGLVASGEDLLQQAMRNPEIGVGHLDKWAEMMQILKDISGNRMPSVADLLKQGALAAKQTPPSPNSQSNNAPKAGQDRSKGGGPADPKKPGEAPPPSQVPAIVDRESDMNQPQQGKPKDPSESKPSQPRLTLATTTLGPGKASNNNQPKPPASEKVDEAVKQQQDLLTEFEKIADELNRILANLEGSTLVKRLKAASRKQQQVAERLGSVVTNAFGVSERDKNAQKEVFTELASVEGQSAQDVSHIMDDMSAYFERSQFARFKSVLDDMRTQDVTAALRYLGDDLRKENGLSISQAEFWSETLDRWAEDLVGVCKGGQCPGCKSKGSLPPSIVLEVLQILEAEVNLREQTRVAEQARPAVAQEEHKATGDQLAETQDGLQVRVDKVVERILELPDAESDFGKELQLLGAVSMVMEEATSILGTPETGPPAIGAETEAIELLLQTKRCCNGGGGGGASPGGGGGGTTEASALALVGSGVNEKEVREDKGTEQATGTSGPVLPEEFRSGLDQYFNQLEAK